MVSKASQHSTQREENLRAMRSPASIALAIAALGAVTLVSVFHDHPWMKSPQIVASLRHYVTAQ
jgi:hypothetical protein